MYTHTHTHAGTHAHAHILWLTGRSCPGEIVKLEKLHIVASSHPVLDWKVKARLKQQINPWHLSG